MSKNPVIDFIEKKHIKKSVPKLSAGDIVKVHQRIVEAGKERIQIFEGTVIKTAGSSGMDGTFTVRRIASGVGVERTFPLHSPKVAKIERVRASKVRQSRLYYLRGLAGRKGRLKGQAVKGETWEEKAEVIVPGSETTVEEEKPEEQAEEETEVIEENPADEISETKDKEKSEEKPEKTKKD